MALPARLLLLPLAVSLSACALQIDLPQDFLRLQQVPRDQVKATTPDEARLWVRELDDPDQGTLEFWSQTLENHFTRDRGYELVQVSDVTDAEGHPGKALQFHVPLRGEPYGYLVALFVIEGSGSHTIRIAELVARRPVYDARVDAIVRALSTLR